MGETRGPKVLSAEWESSNQDSSSVREAKGARSLLRSGMCDLITGTINEGSDAGLRRRKTRRGTAERRRRRRRRGRSWTDGRTDGRTSKDLLLLLRPSVRPRSAARRTGGTAAAAAAAADIFRSRQRRRRPGRKSTAAAGDGSGVMPRAMPVPRSDGLSVHECGRVRQEAVGVHRSKGNLLVGRWKEKVVIL